MIQAVSFWFSRKSPSQNCHKQNCQDIITCWLNQPIWKLCNCQIGSYIRPNYLQYFTNLDFFEIRGFPFLCYILGEIGRVRSQKKLTKHMNKLHGFVVFLFGVSHIHLFCPRSKALRCRWLHWVAPAFTPWKPKSRCTPQSLRNIHKQWQQHQHPMGKNWFKTCIYINYQWQYCLMILFLFERAEI